MPDRTTMETQIAEDMAHILDYMGRVTDAVKDGKWIYGAEKAGQLQRAATRLVAHLDAAAKSPSTSPRPGEVDKKIRAEGRHYWLGRLLYPVTTGGQETLARHRGRGV